MDYCLSNAGFPFQILLLTLDLFELENSVPTANYQQSKNETKEHIKTVQRNFILYLPNPQVQKEQRLF